MRTPTHPGTSDTPKRPAYGLGGRAVLPASALLALAVATQTVVLVWSRSLSATAVAAAALAASVLGLGPYLLARREGGLRAVPRGAVIGLLLAATTLPLIAFPLPWLLQAGLLRSAGA
jgi:hypothetical protein